MNKTQSIKTQSIVILVISLSLLSMSLSEGIDQMTHHSFHDEFMSDKKIQFVDTRSRLLANEAAEFRNFRFVFDWKMTDDWLSNQSTAKKAGLTSKINYMKNILLTVNNYFADRFQVKSRKTLTFNNPTTCHGATVDPKFLGKAIEQDLVIVLKPHNQSTSWFAAAGACLADSTTQRPVMGAVFLNFYHIHVTEVGKYNLPGIFIHELMHVLGFSGYWMEKRGLLKAIKHGNTTRTAVVSAGVVKHAREYFNCPELEGIPLENGGGGGSAGSHWEKTIFPAELMNPQVAAPMKISEFSIKLMEDLGWYKGVNAHEDYTYLKGDGCHTIKGGECNSSKSDEFCAADDWNRDHCYPNKLGKAHCGKSSTFMGSCGLVMPKNNAYCTVENDSNHTNFQFESYGPHSRCVMAQKGSNYNAACLRMRCTTDKVEIQFGTEVHTCEGSGPQTVSTKAYTGKVDCPAFSEMCTELLEKRCPMDCYGQGICMSNGTCQCLGGFSGDDCNKGLPKEQDPFVTGFDSRNKGEEKKEDDEEKKEDDPKEKEEDDEEKEDDDEDSEDDEEERKEEEEEKDTPKTEKAKQLEITIARVQTYEDKWTLSNNKHAYKVSIYKSCADGKTNWNKRCAKALTRMEAAVVRSQSQKDRIADQLTTLEAELASELTTRQAEAREMEESAKSIFRTKEHTDKFIVYLEVNKENFEKREIAWTNWVDRYSAIVEKYKNVKYMAKWIKRMLAYIDYFKNYRDYYVKAVEITNKKIDELRAVGEDEFDDIANAEIEAEIQSEMDAESEAANNSDSGDNNGAAQQVTAMSQV